MRATDKRANGLQGEYRRKAKAVDKEILAQPTQQRGPIETRLDEFGEILGLYFGAWGEASRDIHVLIQALAESRLAFTGMQRGRPGSKAELGMITGQIRRRISLVAVKAQVECLLSKLHQVGPGNQQMAKYRQWALKEDERMSRERKANWMLRYEGV